MAIRAVPTIAYCGRLLQVSDMPDSRKPEAQLGQVAPFFIVREVALSIEFYRDRLGFEVTFLGPDDNPYFALLNREAAWLMLKAITPEVQPIPNSTRHHWARWDAYIHTSEPDRLAEEFASRGVEFKEPLSINSDNLRGFEIMDVDGYVLYFGCPAPRAPLPASPRAAREGE